MLNIQFSKKNGTNKHYLGYYINSSKQVSFTYEASGVIHRWRTHSYAEAFALARELTQTLEPGKDNSQVRTLAKARLAQKHLTDYHEEAVISIVETDNDDEVVGSITFTPNPLRT